MKQRRACCLLRYAAANSAQRGSEPVAPSLEIQTAADFWFMNIFLIGIGPYSTCKSLVLHVTLTHITCCVRVRARTHAQVYAGFLSPCRGAAARKPGRGARDGGPLPLAVGSRFRQPDRTPFFRLTPALGLRSQRKNRYVLSEIDRTCLQIADRRSTAAGRAAACGEWRICDCKIGAGQGHKGRCTGRAQPGQARSAVPPRRWGLRGKN